MKIICTQENLNKSIAIAEKAIGKSFTLPILQNILISAESGNSYIKLSATDLEVGIEVQIPAKVDQEGAITIPARLFSGFIRTLPQDNIEITENNKSVLIKCKNFKSTIKGESASDFPLMPTIKNSTSFSLKGFDFSSGIVSVIHSVSNLDIKPEITGICIKFSETDTCFAATDSFRLAEKVILGSEIKNVKHKLIIPRKTCDLISRVFTNSEDLLSIETDGAQLSIKNNPDSSAYMKINLVSRIIDGEYPDYEQIIPKKFLTSIDLSKDEFISHIRTASLFSSKINEVVLNINSEKQQMEISSKDQDYGEHNSIMPCSIEGGSIKATFNYNYLLEGLNTISSPNITIKMNEPSTPALITSSENDGFRYIVMPIRA